MPDKLGALRRAFLTHKLGAGRRGLHPRPPVTLSAEPPPAEARNRAERRAEAARKRLEKRRHAHAE